MKTNIYQQLAILFAISILSLSSVFAQTLSPSPTPTVVAQGNGTLSFNPSSTSFATGENRSIDIVWTGDDIIAAEVHIDVPSGIEIISFAPGPELTILIDQPENGEAQVAKLSAGNITSGSTLFSMIIANQSCTDDGTITFDAEEVLVPDVTVSFTELAYSCTGGGAVTDIPLPSATISTLPETKVNNYKNMLIIIIPIVIIAGALGIIVLHHYFNFLKIFDNRN